MKRSGGRPAKTCVVMRSQKVISYVDEMHDHDWTELAIFQGN